LAAFGLGQAFALGQRGLWTMSPVFPQDVIQPFVDAVSTLVPHATAIMIADVMRRRLIKKGAWFSSSGPRRRANSANYIRVAIVCGVAGYVGLILWGLTQQAPTSEGFKIDIPNALLAMVTGGFYVYHLDNAEIGCRPSRWWELGWQTVLTGVCGLVAACATWEIIFGAASAAIDNIVLTTVVNATVGFAFAWYIPLAAAAARHDPLSDASEERVGALATAARERLADADAAIWLDTPHPALGNKPPRAAGTRRSSRARFRCLPPPFANVRTTQYCPGRQTNHARFGQPSSLSRECHPVLPPLLCSKRPARQKTSPESPRCDRRRAAGPGHR
jgi:hypothetical protein